MACSTWAGGLPHGVGGVLAGVAGAGVHGARDGGGLGAAPGVAGLDALERDGLLVVLERGGDGDRPGGVRPVDGGGRGPVPDDDLTGVTVREGCDGGGDEVPQRGHVTGDEQRSGHTGIRYVSSSSAARLGMA
jgi:hypothetical protein